MPQVAIVMGSESDKPTMQLAADILDSLGVSTETVVMSAHRTPEKVREFAKTARDRGISVIIAGAGMAAHLPGVIAAWTPLPVLGVPLPAGELRGQDSLYSMVQMPSGVPVATFGIGNSGARNAAYFAAALIAVADPAIRNSYDEFRRRQSGE
ncbi:MAG TPA: 5-(carboxyamino)imidazole ribonucleotide mutase [Chloroflexota bacterium]